MSAVGLRVDLYSNELTTVQAARESQNIVFVDLETSNWEIADWLEQLRARPSYSEAVFVTTTTQSDVLEHYSSWNDKTGGKVAYVYTAEQALLRNSDAEMLRILELFAAEFRHT